MTTTPAHRQQADRLITAVNEALAATAYRDETPLPRYGTAPPITQPGRPPMSQRATDTSALMLSGSVLTATLGGSATAILWASGHADPVVVGAICTAPAVAILAISRLVKAVSKTTPPEHHHHYAGPVHQQTVNSTSRLWGKTTNNL